LLSISVVYAAVASAAYACPNCKKGYIFGPGVAVGNGMAFTWAKIAPGPKFKIESMGVTLTESALEGLPKDLDPKMPMKMYILELPPQIQGQPFDHVELDWNPVGHEPEQIYGRPHFDIHFYTIDEAAKEKILARGGDLKKCNLKPSPEFIPSGYILPPGTVVPRMGAHWIDPKTPELNGQPFSSTFLYGSYNGKTAFFEPMITHEFLASKPDFHQPIPMPKAFDKTGFYPCEYGVKYNEARKEITISLDNLIFAKAKSPAKTMPAKPKKKA